ncbi:MAG TPA: ornithine carbamoyltransferase [Solirubrobacteraceae bacterium]|nr:ornithine carbamoyltransferase [Solirubrobacteraceae bacterium]
MPEARPYNPAKDFIDTQDYEREELERLLDLVALLKDADKDGACPELLRDVSLGMIFEEPSTRTRVSFEVAMVKLGGHALYLRPGEIHMGARESLYDTAKVLSRMCDVIEARTLKHETCVELARWSDVPVINGLTDVNHPTQAICDIFTMREKLGDLSGRTCVFVGDRTNVCSSTLWITTMFGMNVVHAAPPAYQAPEEWVREARRNAERYGGSVTVTDDVRDAVRIADVVYTDLWWWVDQEDEIPERRAAFMPTFQVNAELMSLTDEHCIFMHCLPASRGVEVTDEVIDGPRSVVFDQSENRLHAEKGILVWRTYGRVSHDASPELRAYHRGRAESFLAGAGWDRIHPPAAPSAGTEVAT